MNGNEGVMMWALLMKLATPKALIGLALAVALAASHTWAWRAGSASVQQDWDAQITMQARETLRSSERARDKETKLQANVLKVTNELLKQKQARAADAKRTDDRVRGFEAAITASQARSDSTSTARINASITRIAGECGRALGALDKRAREYRGIAQGLQDYINSVRLEPE